MVLDVTPVLAAKNRQHESTAADPLNFTGAVYRTVTLYTGDVFFEEVWVLQAGKFDSKPVFNVTNHAARRFADGDCAADCRPHIGCDRDRCARCRKIDNAAGDVDAAWQDQLRNWVTRRESTVAAVFWKIKNLPVGKPSELGGELVAFARGRRD